VHERRRDEPEIGPADPIRAREREREREREDEGETAASIDAYAA